MLRSLLLTLAVGTLAALAFGDQNNMIQPNPDLNSPGGSLEQNQYGPGFTPLPNEGSPGLYSNSPSFNSNQNQSTTPLLPEEPRMTLPPAGMQRIDCESPPPASQPSTPSCPCLSQPGYLLLDTAQPLFNHSPGYYRNVVDRVPGPGDDYPYYRPRRPYVLIDEPYNPGTTGGCYYKMYTEVRYEGREHGDSYRHGDRDDYYYRYRDWDDRPWGWHYWGWRHHDDDDISLRWVTPGV